MGKQDKSTPQENPGKNRPDPGKEKGTNPGKPNNDPDQTPEREVNQPPVADPDKSDKPGKIGFQDDFLLY